MRFLTTLLLTGLSLSATLDRALARDAAEHASPIVDFAASAPASRGAATTLPTRPLELVVARWAEECPARTRDGQLDELAPVGLDQRRARIVLRLETSPESLCVLPRADGPPLVSGVLEKLPILGQAWAIANDIVPGSSARLRDLTLELGGESLLPVLPDALRDFGGGLARGPYSRADDANGGAFTIDVRVVLSWRPTSVVHLEAGYAVAYAGGEYGAQLDGESGRRAEFLRHGPWVACGLDF